VRCEVRGPLGVPLPDRLPTVAWRRGVDVHPLDATDPAIARWLDALIWPEQHERRGRLRAALAVLRRHPVELVAGDALELVPALAAEAPRDATLVVMHSSVMAYLSYAEQERFARMCASIGAHDVGAEGVPGVAWAFNELTLDGVRLATADGHGRWVEWTEGTQPTGGRADASGASPAGVTPR
jgi:hypothetical protein